MKNLIVYLILIISIVGISCNDNDPEPDLGLYDQGVFISNEGNFGSGNGSISFYSYQKEEVFNQVYSTANNGYKLGDVVQSMYAVDNQLYIIVNNSNKVEVAGLDSLKSLSTIQGLSLPRYMTSYENKGYVTEWVDFSSQGRVAVIDLQTGTIRKNITTDYGAEGLIVSNGKLFVSNNFTTTVSVIDLSTESVKGSIEVGNSPGIFVIDKNNDLWVICAGGYDQDYAPLGDGQLVRIDPANESILNTVELGMNVSGKMAINPEGDQLYYIVGNQLFMMKVSATSAPDSPLVTEEEAQEFYGVGIGPSGEIYCSDDKGFQGRGVVYRYLPNGDDVDQFTVGIGPNGFIFH